MSRLSNQFNPPSEYSLVDPIETETVGASSSHAGRAASSSDSLNSHFGSAPLDGGDSSPEVQFKLDLHLPSRPRGCFEDTDTDDDEEEPLSMVKYTRSIAKKVLRRNGELVIAVMGMTGSGKTTFISKVTGAKDLEIGHSLTSCTQEVRTTRTTIDGRVVHFVDTPGFSDTHLSDTEVLELIAKYLAAAYKDDVKLSGIIYLHPISETRMTSHATRNLQMFQKLTGDPNLKSVVLVTSMWDRVSEPEGLARQRELEGKFWKVLLACGAKVMRYEGTPGSARSIAGTLMGNTPFFVQIQKEMGQGNKALRDTAAGQQVMEQLMLMKETHERQLAEMAEKLRNSAALNKKLVDALNERYQAELRALQKARNDERRLNEENMDTLRARLAVLETGKRCTVM